jgi:hypothetical protein
MTDAQIQEKLKVDGYTNVQITEHDKDYVDVGIQPGHPQKLRDQSVYTGRVIAKLADFRTVFECLKTGCQDRSRRSQFVRRVCHELTLYRECLLQAIECMVGCGTACGSADNIRERRSARMRSADRRSPVRNAICLCVFRRASLCVNST